MSFIRQASSTFDKYGAACYYVDGSYIRRASTTFDKYGAVCYYIGN